MWEPPAPRVPSGLVAQLNDLLDDLDADSMARAYWEPVLQTTIGLLCSIDQGTEPVRPNGVPVTAQPFSVWVESRFDTVYLFGPNGVQAATTNYSNAETAGLVGPRPLPDKLRGTLGDDSRPLPVHVRRLLIEAADRIHELERQAEDPT